MLIEDNPGDVRLIQEAFKEAKVTNEIYSVLNGDDALRFLRKEGKFASVQTPDLILLDLNLPGRDGHEVLPEIKSDSQLRKIPVVVLSNSRLAKDIIKAYDHSANCYIAKPIDVGEFFNVIKKITDFWITFVKLPS
ncbi:MAG: response regulator [Candidatus Thorarchaeota archaeon]